MNKEALLILLEEFGTDPTSIHDAYFCYHLMDEIDLDLDIKADMLGFTSGKYVRIPTHYTYQKGYAIGFLIQGIAALLLNKEIEPMKAQFPTSVYYASEVREKTEKAIKEIRSYLKRETK